MNRIQRELAKAHLETIRQQRIALEQKRAEEKARKDAAYREALHRPSLTSKGRVDRYLANLQARETQVVEPHPLDPVLASLPTPPTPEFIEVCRAIEARTPKLFERDYMRAARWMTSLPLVRPVSSWKPRGKSRDTLFRSLCDHLLAKYPVPALCWNAFFDQDNAPVLTPLVGHVAAGGSLHAYAKESFPVPLTRAMCHELLRTPAEHGFVPALRRVQIHASGGDRHLFNAFMTTEQAKRLTTREHEAFWQTVLHWFAQNPMLEPGQVGPLIDFIAAKRRESADFSMKGRSVLAMMRGLREWHGNLHVAKNFRDETFNPSGFPGASFSDYQRKEPDGSVVHETWSVREVLTAKELLEEGRRMKHCVYSYSHSILSGGTSIWQLVMQDGEGPTGYWAMLTVQVSNQTRTIVQARGQYNKLPDHRSHAVLIRWANQAGLTVNLGRW